MSYVYSKMVGVMSWNRQVIPESLALVMPYDDIDNGQHRFM